MLQRPRPRTARLLQSDQHWRSPRTRSGHVGYDRL